MTQPTTDLLLDLYHLVDRLSSTDGLPAALDEILAATIELLQGDMGHVQLIDGTDGIYRIAAHRGFDADYIAYFDGQPQEVIGRGPALEALEKGDLVVVEDISLHPLFADHSGAITKAGIVAVVARPLSGRDGKPAGAISVHYRSTAMPSEERRQISALYARLAADTIEREQHRREQRTVEAALKESEQRYRAIAERFRFATESAGMYAWEFQPETGKMVFSGNVEKVLGFLPYDDPVKNQETVLEPEPSFLVDEWKAALAGIRPYDLEIKLGHPQTKEPVWISTKGYLVRGEGGPDRLVGLTQNITLRKLAEQALKENEEKLLLANKAKDEFLALISHELRTPLTTILGNGLSLTRLESLPPEQRAQAADIVSESQRLGRIIENLLLMTRLESGNAENEPVLLRSLVDEGIAVFRERFPGREIERRVEGEIPIAAGYPTFITEILDNLLSNAHKYSPPDTAIEVTLGSTAAGKPSVTVRDHGIGIDQEDLDDLFKPFFRGLTAIETAQGMGLGLSVCKRLVEAQGGTIWAEAADGGGAQITFVLEMMPG